MFWLPFILGILHSNQLLILRRMKKSFWEVKKCSSTCLNLYYMYLFIYLIHVQACNCKHETFKFTLICYSVTQLFVFFFILFSFVSHRLLFCFALWTSTCAEVFICSQQKHCKIFLFPLFTFFQWIQLNFIHTHT